jgi:hypothetical protein
VPEDKLTKELCCVEGFQSFWAISRCGKAAHVTNAVPGAHEPLKTLLRSVPLNALWQLSVCEIGTVHDLHRCCLPETCC